MARFVTTVDLSAPIAQVFDFFRRPANLLRVAPPSLHLQLENPPDVLQLGSRLALCGRRWGIRYRSVTEVIAFQPGLYFLEEQKEGAFRKWVHAHRFEATANTGTHVVDEIDYEPPGGMLGLLLTAGAVERELNEFFRYRNEQLTGTLGMG
jgi:ligand-binding SRPBCC domain-containing protein